MSYNPDINGFRNTVSGTLTVNQTPQIVGSGGMRDAIKIANCGSATVYFKYATAPPTISATNFEELVGSSEVTPWDGINNSVNKWAWCAAGSVVINYVEGNY